MKNMILTITVVFFAICAILNAIIITRYSKLLVKYHDLLKYLKSLNNCISSARWGNLQIKARKGSSILTEEISKNLNSLLESILDRDKMIQEYVEKEKENNNIKEEGVPP